MLAVDTNLIVRYFTHDDARQFSRAVAIIEGRDVFVSTTVLLECEWVLRSGYGYEAHRIAERLEAFAGLPHVTLENPALAAAALTCMKDGMDFADALHLAAAAHCEALLTFDEGFIKAASGTAGPPVRKP